jgi:hypothetical protein
MLLIYVLSTLSIILYSRSQNYFNTILPDISFWGMLANEDDNYQGYSRRLVSLK